MVRLSLCSIFLVLLSVQTSPGQAPTATQTLFFEQHIRPVLVEKCYKCHNSVETDEAGLALDFRDGIRTETEHGYVVVPSDPDTSLLLKVIRHEIDDLEMPEDGGRLDDETIANFEKWIQMGAPDPRDSPPSKDELNKATSWETTLANRKQWWSLQPIRTTTPPALEDVDHPVDRFIAKKLQDSDLRPSAPADRRTLIRRLSFVLTGLPPSTKQINAFVQDERRDAYERLVDEMLASERYGEHWARHWMDLMRYADSHGSEGDPAIPDIYRYRDYLIRAFNQDVPYDQLLREHVAGDLIDNPRINEDLGINESLIGPAHWRLVFHGFAPTDALDEKVRFTDDQINVFSKAFLGLTVSCARCHDHKFDAISQADYYALFGVLASCRPTLHDVNVTAKQQTNVRELTQLKKSIRLAISTHWLDNLADVTKRLTKDPDWKENQSKHEKPGQLLYLMSEVQRKVGDNSTVEVAWQDLKQDWTQHQGELTQDRQRKNAWHWDLTKTEDYDSWFRDGNGLPIAPSKPGEFRLGADDRVISAVLPSGIHANTLSTKHRAFVSSPRFKLDGEYKVWLRLTGGGQAMSRYAVENYPRDGTVYPIRDINNDRWFWQEYNVKYWSGDYVHLEVNTARDAPLRTRGADRSWFSIREVIVRDADSPNPIADDRAFTAPLFATEKAPQSLEDVASIYVDAIAAAIKTWQADTITDAQAALLNECVLENLLENNKEHLGDAITGLLDKYEDLDDAVPSPTRVPGLMEADVFDQPLFSRGDHRKPTDAVPRRFLEAINPEPFATKQSGRLELAQNLVDPTNPLVSRVMVNRIWHYVFGQGIVPTPDNFGKLGQKPSHRELLDYLATRFADDWSIKTAIRLLVTSKTFQQQSTANPKVVELDPENRLLSHANVRRLEAESIRDTLLVVSGKMNSEMYGPGFSANSDVPRRAVYIRNRRNSLDQFLEAFNAPVPFATTGRRSKTNVPAQSLTMLNAPFVLETARAWASKQTASAKKLSTRDRMTKMFESALGRQPTESENTALSQYVQTMQQQASNQQTRLADLNSGIEKNEVEVMSMLSPIRERLLEEKSKTQDSNNLAPIAAWDFESDLSDSIGELHATIQGKAAVKDGALVVDGGFATTGPLQRDLAAKTLVATIQLDNLTQRGGGVVSVQTLDGTYFDSLVFGEREDGHWMSGSDGFSRTENFGGPREKTAKDDPVHLAIAYDADGTIRGYRNGEPYGKPIRKSDLRKYGKDSAQILFGLRHGDGGNGRLLRGRIFDAQLFDRALTADEVVAVAKGKTFVSDKDVLAELSGSDRDRVARLRSEVTKLQQQREELGQPIDEQERWARVGHAIFNLKEFIYIK